MEVYTEKQRIAVAIHSLKAKKQTIGLVPTMGALHVGHLQLVKQALKNNHKAVVTVFVNPTQFDNQEDLKTYPRTLEKDLLFLKTINTTNLMVYTPSIDDVYEGATLSQRFDFDGLEFEMEGKFRQGHFNGVGTVVKRFFDIIKPDNAYFGEKDFQQLVIIKKLAKKKQIPVNIVGCKIYRENTGLALSSRNTKLKPEFKKVAPFIFKTLNTAKELFLTKSANKVSEWVAKEFMNQKLLDLEYFIIADVDTLKPIKRKSKTHTYRAFIAVYADDVRLIDNIALN